MYKFGDNQIRFEDFEQPVGMRMSKENRWVKKAELIPWSEIEKRYAALFKNKKGNVAKPLRLALGACIIQAEYGYSDEETALQIQEGPYLQFFCGYSRFEDGRPFDASLMVYFRKRLTPEILGEINELIIKRAKEWESPSDNDNDGKPKPPGNGGTLIVDATCAPSQIKYPQDTELLNEAREITEEIIDTLHNPANGKKPRTYRKQARKAYLNCVRKRKKTTKEIRRAIKKQLGYLRRNLESIDKMLPERNILPARQTSRLETVQTLYIQQKYMHDNRVRSVTDRIVSLSQPWLRPIVRGKAKSSVEFGTKLDISVADGFVRLERQSFDPYHEAHFLKETIERYRERCGRYPNRVLADKTYRNRDNLAFCKEHGIRLSGPALGRPKKDEVADKTRDYQDICDRVEVERSFSLAKRKCGLGTIYTRLKETSEHTVALAVVVLNLRRIFRRPWRLLFEFLFLSQKFAFVQ